MSDAMMKPEFFEEGRRYTYADYLEWEGPERCQLINGEVFMMASPSVVHQSILGELFLQFGTWLRGKTCKAFISPMDVRLFPKEDNSDNTVVQPDMLVVCDKNKISKGSINGAPDLVIEIISPSNSHSDLFLKFQYYMKAGVREYWVIDPESKQVQVYVYENGRYLCAAYTQNDRISVTILPGLEIALETLWASIP